MTDSSTAPTVKRRRRPRRNEADLRKLILNAAKEEFRLHGYEGARTKAIADRAAVSESLLFRYFGPKADLLEAVTLSPFTALIQSFYDRYGSSGSLEDHRRNTRLFVEELTHYLRENRMLIARALQPDVRGKASAGATVLHDYFVQSVGFVSRLQPLFKRGGDADIDLTVRVGFGMVVASVLFSDWLFEEEPDPQALNKALVHYLDRSVVP
ncbi:MULTISPECIES: TetR/AcrR family transcriptional regulator [unclassified Sphingobium]|uniref:TetR/AcrR family transcriptional regulator n=1 Tax=unclassified Sphingobium TaxID=2611147 RepID=UPI000D174C8D|nr:MULTISPECIES: TetR/AcrR family transcriptional regulator [unclassified Sphingobium]MBG6119975.1 AcrR family transcriptional regulator [Sphingobium sp. JAI105]TWC99586.1 TetR family transcriptional regulator [Sphingobium sp. AEW010]TWD18977.1 TetR family transcriptional regulator [Sphingobium sp. AEW013]TWD21848.1 TetR family transcriptional regulator [Sphingobium sp. AEW001]